MGRLHRKEVVPKWDDFSLEELKSCQIKETLIYLVEVVRD